MVTHPDLPRLLTQGYVGHILHGTYSQALQQRVVECFDHFRAFESTGNPMLHYIAAWHTTDKQIWYEFVSKHFADMWGCSIPEVAQVFRDSIIDWRHYKDGLSSQTIIKEVVSRQELDSIRRALRDASQQAGTIDAVYKVATPQNQTIWLKDQAKIETYPEDHTALALGYLTVISKEMQREEQGEKRVDELQTFLDKLRHLSGMLAICASCKRIRDETGQWRQIEEYIHAYTDAVFSHGICPICLAKALQELDHL
jgi:hypothetical protein